MNIMNNILQLFSSKNTPAEMHFLQEYHYLPVLTYNGAVSVYGLCLLGGISADINNIMHINQNLPSNLDGMALTVSRVIQAFIAATKNKRTSDNFNIDAQVLEEVTARLDRHLQYAHGFNYIQILEDECRKTLPEERKISMTTPLEDFCAPIKNFLYNMQYCQNPIIGTVLGLLLIRRIIIDVPGLRSKDVDWSPLIYAINPYQIEWVQSRINAAGVFIKNTYLQQIPTETPIALLNDIVDTNAEEINCERDYSDAGIETRII